MPSMIGLSWLGVEVTASLPSLPTISHAHPEPKRVRPALPNASLKAGEAAELGRDRLGQGTGRLAAAAGLHELPEQRVVGMSAAIVAHGRPDGFGHRVQVRDQVLDRLALKLRMVLERVVEVGDVGLVVLRVVDLHRLGVDVRLERSVVVRQRRQGVFGHDVVLARCRWWSPELAPRCTQAHARKSSAAPRRERRFLLRQATTATARASRRSREPTGCSLCASPDRFNLERPASRVVLFQSIDECRRG